jgi:hypothetical protein
MMPVAAPLLLLDMFGNYYVRTCGVERGWQVKLHRTPFVTESLELDLSSF